MASSDLDLKLNISANAADAIQKLKKTQDGISSLGDQAAKAKTDTDQLKQAFDGQTATYGLP